MDKQRGFTGLRTLAAVVAVSFFGAACGESADPTLPLIPGAIPTLSVVSHNADSTRLQLANPSDQAWSMTGGGCPIAVQKLVDGSWQSAGFLHGASPNVDCDMVQMILPAGRTGSFWAPYPLPEADSPIRLVIVVTSEEDGSNVVLTTAPLE